MGHLFEGDGAFMSAYGRGWHVSDCIDFVVTWVDGSDSEWLAQKRFYQKQETDAPWSEWSSGDVRYRDWGLLPYWFRAVETFAPWVRTVHFVTWGHVPSWLNMSCEKLHIVRHEDYIPQKYLPTFNSHAIEWNIHRIEGLSERFVYFNDDMFLLRPLAPEDFFEGGLPRDYAALNTTSLSRVQTNYQPFNAMVINEHFDKGGAIRSNLFKWINPRYGAKPLMKTLLLWSFPGIQGLDQDHLPMNLLKSTFETLWELEGAELDKTCSDRFRGFYGVSPWLARDWQRMEGRFVPAPKSRGLNYGDPGRPFSDAMLDDISSQGHQMICLNDFCETWEDFERWGALIRGAFQKILPEPSSFELSGDKNSCCGKEG